VEDELVEEPDFDIHKNNWLGREAGERKWSERDWSWVIPDNALANSSGEEYPMLGTSWS